jgi:hypothetical protein
LYSEPSLAQSTKENGKMVYRMEKVDVFMSMEVFMMDDGRMDSHMDLVKKKIRTALIMMVIGSMEKLKEKVLRN